MRHFGDAPENPGPIATDLSYSIKPKAVAKAMRKVADWQLERSQPYFDRLWTWSALYVGFMAASDSLGDPKYRDAMMAMGQKFDWKLSGASAQRRRSERGADLSGALSAKKDPAMLKPTQNELDAILAAPRGSAVPGKEIAWWWCDALFMAPPVWARMYAATGDRKYVDYLDRGVGQELRPSLGPKEHLYARDISLSHQDRANGKKMFWSRGNGWVMAGIVRTLPVPSQGRSGAREVHLPSSRRWPRAWLNCKVPMDFGGQDCLTPKLTICRRCPAPPSLPMRWPQV